MNNSLSTHVLFWGIVFYIIQEIHSYNRYVHVQYSMIPDKYNNEPQAVALFDNNLMMCPRTGR